MPAEKPKPDPRTSRQPADRNRKPGPTKTTGPNKGPEKPAKGPEKPAKGPEKPAKGPERTAKGPEKKPEVGRNQARKPPEPDPKATRGRNVADRQAPEPDTKPTRERGRSVSDRQAPKKEEPKPQRGKSDNSRQREASKKEDEKAKATSVRDREKQKQIEREMLKEKEKEKQRERERLKEEQKQRELDKKKEQERSRSQRKSEQSSRRQSTVLETPATLLDPHQILMSPTPQKRKTWDRENIFTDLAREDDEEINPRPDKIEIVKMGNNQEMEEVQAESGFIEGDPDDINVGGDAAEPDGDDYDAYEDDFEDYEEDFEDEDESDGDDDDDDSDDSDDDEISVKNLGDIGTSSDEESEDDEVERRMTAYRRRQEANEMEEVKRAMKRENSVRYNSRSEANVNNNADTNGGVPVEAPSARSELKSGRGFINFSAAKARQTSQVAAGRARRRGDELLSMIRLDIVTFALFELPPIRYEDFMRTFGTSNMTQNSMQTGEDNLHEEIQTEKIVLLDKWTQRPPAASILSAEENFDLFMQNVRGCGGQMSYEAAKTAQKSWEFAERSDSHRLAQFMRLAGNAFLTLLEEESMEEENRGDQDKEVVFSEKVTYLTFGDYPGLSGGPVEGLAFAPDQEGILLTIHGPVFDDSKDDESLESRSYLCVWNVRLPNQPLKLLVAGHRVTAASFSPSKASLVLAGLVDGCVCVWDLREAVFLHREVQPLPDVGDWLMRSPTYITNDEVHTSAITAIKPLPVVDIDLANLEDVHASGSIPVFQVVSIEREGGKLVIWTVLDSQHDLENHLGLAHWGSVRLVCTTIIDLNAHTIGSGGVILPSVEAHDVTFDPIDGTHLFVATQTGMVLHVSSHPDYKPSPRHYKPELDSSTACNALTFCPFGEPFFLAGSDDGTVRLHSVVHEKPLITWPGSVNGVPISKLIWSPSRPCVFILLDSGSRIHLWDLGAGDIYPVHGVEFDDKVHAIALSPELPGSKDSQLLAIGMDGGRVEVHQLKPEYKSKGVKECKNELEKFLHYVSII